MTMLKTLFGSLAICLMLADVIPARADDRGEANAVLDKAIRAAGGEANLARFQGFIMKGKGTYHEADRDIQVTFEFFFQGPDQYRSITETKFDRGKSRVVQVVNGDKGWTKVDNDPAETM